jgi:hypothetical protein
MVTLDNNTVSHKWLVTYWRGGQPEGMKSWVRFLGSNGTQQLTVEEDVLMVLEDGRALASIPLDDARLGNGRVWVELVTAQGDILRVASVILTTAQGTDLLIWDRQ